MSEERSKIVRWLPWVAMVIAFLGVSPSLAGGYALDDAVAVAGSTCVTTGFDFVRIVTSNFWCEPGPHYSIESWRPWPVLVWWGLHQLGGSPLPFHLLNVALHLACTALVFGVGRDLGMSRASAGWGAVLFAALAIHVDAVAPVVGASELWSALFVVLALRSFLRGRWWSVLFGVLAVAAKESGVLVLPLLIVVALLGPKGKRSRNRSSSILLIIAVGAAVLGVLAFRAYVLGSWTAAHIPAHVNPLVGSSWGTRLLTAIALVGRYHRVTVTGGPLSADYAHAAIGVGSDVAVVDLALGAVALLGWPALLWRFRALPHTRVLSLWLLGTTCFISNALFLLPAIFAERLFYLPSMALALLGGGLTTAGLRSASIRPALVYTVVALFVGGQTLASAAHAWRHADELRLIEATVESTPNNARARMWLAMRQLRAGELELAREHAEVAAQVRPEWGAPMATLAAIDDLEGRPEAALGKFRAAVELDAADPDVANLFITFLLRYSHVEPARYVYQRHAAARGGIPHPAVAVP